MEHSFPELSIAGIVSKLAPLIKAVHPVTITIGAGASTGTATCPRIDATRCFFVPGGVRGGDNGYSAAEDSPAVTAWGDDGDPALTVVTAETNTANAGSSRVITGTMVELYPWACRGVQKRSIALNSGVTSNSDTGMTAVDTANSFAISLGQVTATTGLEYAKTECSIELTGAQAVLATRGGSDTSTTTAHYVLISLIPGIIKKLEKILIQIAPSGAEATHDQTFASSFDPATTITFWGGRTIDASSSNDIRLLPRVALTGSGATATATRELSSTTKSTVKATAIQFNAKLIKSVQRGTDAIASGQTQLDKTIAATTKALVSFLGFGWNNFATNMDIGFGSLELTSATNLRLRRATSAANTVNESWEVADFT